MPLRQQLNDSMKEAMKSKDAKRLATVRLVLAALKDRDIAARTETSRDLLGDDEILSLMAKMIKQREESALAYDAGKRPELAAGEREEIAIIRSFMPSQMDDAGVKAVAQALIAEMRALPRSLPATPSLAAAAAVFADAVSALERSVEYVVSQYGSEFRQVSVGAVPLLKLFGIVAGGWQLLRSAAIASERLSGAGGASLPANFYRAKIETASFYAHHVLAQGPGLAHAIVHGAASALVEGVL